MEKGSVAEPAACFSSQMRTYTTPCAGAKAEGEGAEGEGSGGETPAFLQPRPVPRLPPMPSDVSAEDIVNYIIQIKCLLGEFYSFSAFGDGIPAELRGGGLTIGGQQARLTPGMQVSINLVHANTASHAMQLDSARSVCATYGACILQYVHMNSIILYVQVS